MIDMTFDMMMRKGYERAIIGRGHVKTNDYEDDR